MKNPLYHRIVILACFFAFTGNVLNAQDVEVKKTSTLTSVEIKSAEDAKLIIEADSSNTNESNNPQIEFKQDGAAVSAKIGFDQDSLGANIFGISTRDNPKALLFSLNGGVGIGQVFSGVALNIKAKQNDGSILNLVGTDNIQKFVVLPTGNTGIREAFSTTSFNVRAKSDDSNLFNLEDETGANKLTVQKDGKIKAVGNMEIVNGSDPTLLIKSGGTSEISGRVAMRQSNLTGMDIYYDGIVDELVFEGFGGGVSEGKHMTIDYNTGNVGIGITENIASGHKLSVNGKIAATEVRIQPQAAWPDYVFADEYELMPLETLKLEIEKNKHLPNIPSADAIHENGIHVGDMQIRMMEKIEELTLYILQLHEEIETLKKKK